MIKHHVQLKLFAHQHNVKQVISTSTMCCVVSPCIVLILVLLCILAMLNWTWNTPQTDILQPSSPFDSRSAVRKPASDPQQCRPFFNHVDRAVFHVCPADIYATVLLDNSDENVSGSEQTLSNNFLTVFCSSFFDFLTCFHVSCCALIDWSWKSPSVFSLFSNYLDG